MRFCKECRDSLFKVGRLIFRAVEYPDHIYGLDTNYLILGSFEIPNVYLTVCRYFHSGKRLKDIYPLNEDGPMYYKMVSVDKIKNDNFVCIKHNKLILSYENIKDLFHLDQLARSKEAKDWNETWLELRKNYFESLACEQS